MRSSLAVLSLLALSACSTSEKTGSQHSVLPTGFHVQLAEGGGFTGLWQGYEVDSTGAVTELTGRSLGAVRKSAGTLSREELVTLWSRLKEAGVLSEPQVSGSGNMTRSLSVTADGQTSHNTWSPSLPASSSLDKVYTTAHALIVKALSHP